MSGALRCGGVVVLLAAAALCATTSEGKDVFCVCNSESPFPSSGPQHPLKAFIRCIPLHYNTTQYTIYLRRIF